MFYFGFLHKTRMKVTHIFALFCDLYCIRYVEKKNNVVIIITEENVFYSLIYEFKLKKRIILKVSSLILLILDQKNVAKRNKNSFYINVNYY